MRAAVIALLLAAAFALAQPPRGAPRLPPAGSPMAPEARAEFAALAAKVTAATEECRRAVAGRPELAGLLPDVEVYEKAVAGALQFDEFTVPKPPAKPADLGQVREVAEEGVARARQLAAGEHPWTTQTGLVVRGYKSRIDDSVQPYGLVVPRDYQPGTPARLDVWWHGRAEQLTELAFVAERRKKYGEFTPPGAIVLHPYGRYCNANKFAGETDTFEAIAHAQKHYSINARRVVARGFSMGGAACWQFAAHFPDYWVAAAPGAGFAETPEFLRLKPADIAATPWYERKLWRLYNSTDYAANLANLPVVAYSGEIDGQKQAADIMIAALKPEGIAIGHLIGPKTGHSYEAKTKAELNRRIDELASKPREATPKRVKFTTFTLRYPGADWVRLTGLAKHWERARVEGAFESGAVSLKTEGVTGLSLTLPESAAKSVTLDGQSVPVVAHYERTDACWQPAPPAAGLAKRPGLTGPIDDAFYERFAFVRPTGTPITPEAGAWVAAELERAAELWRRRFRGKVRLIDDTAVTEAIAADSHLVLWGDPQSNKYWASVADKLPFKPAGASFTLGGESYPYSSRVPVGIFPNPLNPARYVVLNSGPTWTEFDDANNARQVPRLPDYAVINIASPKLRGMPAVVRAGFFGEKWELLARDGE